MLGRAEDTLPSDGHVLLDGVVELKRGGDVNLLVLEVLLNCHRAEVLDFLWRHPGQSPVDAAFELGLDQLPHLWTIAPVAEDAVVALPLAPLVALELWKEGDPGL